VSPARALLTEYGVLMLGGRKSVVPVACVAVVVAGVVSGCSKQPEISHSAATEVCGQTLTYNMPAYDLRNRAKPQVFKNNRVTDQLSFQVAGCSTGASIEFQPAGSADVVLTARAVDGATAGMTIRLLKPGKVSVVRLSPDPATLAVIDVQKRK
jgi:hypothetical protein